MNIMRSIILPRQLIAACLFLIASSALHADEIAVPFGDGSLNVRADFQNVTETQWNKLHPDIAVQKLRFAVVNQTSSAWKFVSLRFDVGAFCGAEKKQWSIPLRIAPLGYKDRNSHLDGEQFVSSLSTSFEDGASTVLPMGWDVSRCHVEIIRTTVVKAEDATGNRFIGSEESPDLSDQMDIHRALRGMTAAEQARLDAVEAADEAKRIALEQAERRRVDAERDRRAAEESARLAKIQADSDAKTAEERRRIRAACSAIYDATIDKKVRDLTVREEQQVRACQSSGLYPPR
jgi:hypothetical protein